MAALNSVYKGTGDALGLEKFNESITSVPEKKKTPEREAAEIMANARNKRADDIKEKLDTKIRDYKEHVKTLTVLKKTKQQLLEEYLSLTKEKKGVLVTEYRKVITQLKVSELITAIDVDSEKRLIITTRPIVVKKSKWKHARLAGVYQIRVDFSKSSVSEAIKILNITQRQGGHDHPHITDTSPCWGNVADDIEKDLKDKNLYELVVDIVDYLQSGADNDGYLQFDGDEEALKKEFAADEKDGHENDTHAWEQFLLKSEKMPEGFCFEMYEQQKKEKKTTLALNSNEQQEGYLQFSDIANGTAQSVTLSAVSTNFNWQTFTTNAMPFSPYQNNHPVNQYEHEMARHLEELGLTEKAAWHFVDYIKPSTTNWIDRLELIERGEVFWLMVFGGNQPQLMSMNAEVLETAPMSVVAREIQRIFINRNDVKEEFNHGSRSVRVTLALNELAQDEQRRVERIQALAEEDRRRTMEIQREMQRSDTVVAQGGDLVMSLNGFEVNKLYDDKPEKDEKVYSPEESMNHYGIVAASDKKPVKKKTLKFI